MTAVIEEITSDVSPEILAAMLEKRVVARFQDTGCIVGFSSRNNGIIGVAPNDYIDLMAKPAPSLVDSAREVLAWARSWADVHVADYTSLR